MSKPPRDPFPYDRDPDSRPIAPGIADSVYVYVQEVGGTVHVLPAGLHRHPKILGQAQPVDFAGDLEIVRGRIKDLTNWSGTFRFSDAPGLLAVAAELERLGFEVLPDAVRLYSRDGSRSTILR